MLLFGMLFSHFIMNKLQENLRHLSEEWYNMLQKVLKISAALKTAKLSIQNIC